MPSNTRTLLSFKRLIMNIVRVVCLVVCLVMGISAPADAGIAIVTSEVEVDVAGKDAADARDNAMKKAVTEGLRELLNKLAAPGQADVIMTMLDSKKVEAIARGTEVLDEKVGDNRYRARVRVSFDADGVSDLINHFDIGNAKGDIPSKTGAFLFITPYEEESAKFLWEEKNPWRNTWKAIGIESQSGDIVVPYGDNSDQSIVSHDNLTSANYALVAPLTIRYGVTDVIILQAKYQKIPDTVLTVVRRRINRAMNEVAILTYRADPEETRDALFTRAARDIAANLLNKKIEEAALAQGPKSADVAKIMMLASISTLDSWTKLREKLAKLPMIEKLEILAMSPQQVDMVVYYRGSQESLSTSINGIGLRLIKHKDYWVVSRD